MQAKNTLKRRLVTRMLGLSQTNERYRNYLAKWSCKMGLSANWFFRHAQIVSYSMQ